MIQRTYMLFGMEITVENHADVVIFHRAVCAGATNRINRSLKTAYAVFRRGAFAKNAPARRLLWAYI